MLVTGISFEEYHIDYGIYLCFLLYNMYDAWVNKKKER